MGFVSPLVFVIRTRALAQNAMLERIEPAACLAARCIAPGALLHVLAVSLDLLLTCHA